MSAKANNLSKLALAKLTNTDSCRGCQYLYFEDTGYSNYTVTDTLVKCALNKNSKIPEDGAQFDNWDWSNDAARGIKDRHPLTAGQMCEEHLMLPEEITHAQFDVDGDVTIEEATIGFDEAARDAIGEHMDKV